MKLGDRIVVIATAVSIKLDRRRRCMKPETLFVARFVGSPPMNVLTRSLGALDVRQGTVLGIRPHDIQAGRRGGT